MTAPGGPAAAGSPLSSVLAELRGGTGTLDGVARRTGLDVDIVRAAVDHLVRLGRVDACALAVGCGSGGCGACPSGVDGRPGCGAPSGSAPGEPVLVALSVRRR